MGSAHARKLVTDRETTVCLRCNVAESPRTRMKGLLGRRALCESEGLLIRPAPSIHTWFMRFSIDVVFLDWDMSVVDIVEDLAPWRMASRRQARSVLELPAGEARRRDLRIGDQLRLVEEGKDQRVPVIYVRVPVKEGH
jgi:uncharacterized protein